MQLIENAEKKQEECTGYSQYEEKEKEEPRSKLVGQYNPRPATIRQNYASSR